MTFLFTIFFIFYFFLDLDDLFCCFFYFGNLLLFFILYLVLPYHLFCKNKNALLGKSNGLGAGAWITKNVIKTITADLSSQRILSILKETLK